MEQSIRILLVDGYDAIRRSLRSLLATERDMLVVGDVADGSAAVAKVDTLRPDVIIIDPATLSGDGPALTASLRAHSPHLRILILTNVIDHQQVAATLQAGVQGYLLKGTTASEILAAVREVFDGRTVFDPAISDSLG